MAKVSIVNQNLQIIQEKEINLRFNRLKLRRPEILNTGFKKFPYLQMTVIFYSFNRWIRKLSVTNQTIRRETGRVMPATNGLELAKILPWVPKTYLLSSSFGLTALPIVRTWWMPILPKLVMRSRATIGCRCLANSYKGKSSASRKISLIGMYVFKSRIQLETYGFSQSPRGLHWDPWIIKS